MSGRRTFRRSPDAVNGASIGRMLFRFAAIHPAIDRLEHGQLAGHLEAHVCAHPPATLVRAAPPTRRARPRMAASPQSAPRPAWRRPNRSVHIKSVASVTRASRRGPATVPPYPRSVTASRLPQLGPSARLAMRRVSRTAGTRARCSSAPRCATCCLAAFARRPAGRRRGRARACQTPDRAASDRLARVIRVPRRRKGNLLWVSPQRPSPPACRRRRATIQRFVELHRNATAELEAVELDVFIGRLIERLEAAAVRCLRPRTPPSSARALSAYTASRSTSHSTPLASTGDVPGTSAPSGRFRSKRPAAGDPPVRAGSRSLSARPPAGWRRERGSQSSRRRRRAALHPPGAASGGARRCSAHRRAAWRAAARHRSGHRPWHRALSGAAEGLRAATPPRRESFADALADVNARLLVGITPLQREILQLPLDEALIAREGDVRAGDDASWAGDEVGVKKRSRPRAALSGPFHPHKGVGLALSASASKHLALVRCARSSRAVPRSTHGEAAHERSGQSRCTRRSSAIHEQGRQHPRAAPGSCWTPLRTPSQLSRAASLASAFSLKEGRELRSLAIT